ncbi:hypothetical protein AZ46_0200800 [Metabacillus indicus LMG 22858]|nr:hypothetical protein AZ46_0200800 [Metabacillus indicus LMG 22858]
MKVKAGKEIWKLRQKWCLWLEKSCSTKASSARNGGWKQRKVAALRGITLEMLIGAREKWKHQGEYCQ